MAAKLATADRKKKQAKRIKESEDKAIAQEMFAVPFARIAREVTGLDYQQAKEHLKSLEDAQTIEHFWADPDSAGDDLLNLRSLDKPAGNTSPAMKHYE